MLWGTSLGLFKLTSKNPKTGRKTLEQPRIGKVLGCPKFTKKKSHLEKLDHRSQNGKNRLNPDAEAWKDEPIAAEASEAAGSCGAEGLHHSTCWSTVLLTTLERMGSYARTVSDRINLCPMSLGFAWSHQKMLQRSQLNVFLRNNGVLCFQLREGAQSSP